MERLDGKRQKVIYHESMAPALFRNRRSQVRDLMTLIINRAYGEFEAAFEPSPDVSSVSAYLATLESETVELVKGFATQEARAFERLSQRSPDGRAPGGKEAMSLLQKSLPAATKDSYYMFTTTASETTAHRIVREEFPTLFGHKDSIASIREAQAEAIDMLVGIAQLRRR